MRESTRKALDDATKQVESAGHKLTEAGFKYHSDRTWVGLTTGGVITVFIKDEEDLVVTHYAATNAEDVHETAPPKKTKKGKKDDS